MDGGTLPGPLGWEKVPPRFKWVRLPAMRWGPDSAAGDESGRGHEEFSPFFWALSLCLKSQLVDLKEQGYWEELLDTYRPDITVKDW